MWRFWRVKSHIDQKQSWKRANLGGTRWQKTRCLKIICLSKTFDFVKKQLFSNKFKMAQYHFQFLTLTLIFDFVHHTSEEITTVVVGISPYENPLRPLHRCDQVFPMCCLLLWWLLLSCCSNPGNITVSCAIYLIETWARMLTVHPRNRSSHQTVKEHCFITWLLAVLYGQMLAVYPHTLPDCSDIGGVLPSA